MTGIASTLGSFWGAMPEEMKHYALSGVKKLGTALCNWIGVKDGRELLTNNNVI